MRIDRQRRKVLAMGGAVALTGLSGCTGATPFVGKRLEDARTFDAGSLETVGVDGRSGDVTVRPTDGQQVRVETVKKAGSVFADLDDVTVDFTTENERLRIVTRKTGDGSFLAGIPHVDVRIELPTGVTLGELRSENGSIDVRGVESDATLVSENGSLRAQDLDGFVTAETENGSVVARGVSGIDGITTENGSVKVDVAAIRGDTTIESENGSIEAALSPDMNASVAAVTERGGLQFRVPNFETETRTGRRVEGTLGSGGPELRFETENGAIRVSELQ